MKRPGKKVKNSIKFQSPKINPTHAKVKSTTTTLFLSHCHYVIYLPICSCCRALQVVYRCPSPYQWEWNAEEANPNDSRSNAQRGKKRRSSSSFTGVQNLRLAAVVTATCLHTLSLPNLYCWLIVCGGSTHSLLNLTGHCKESLLNVAGILGRGLKEWNTETVSEFLWAPILAINLGTWYQAVL